MTVAATATCKHCGLQIEKRPERSNGWIHADGEQRGKHRCALDTYGYDAEPVGEPCRWPCLGYQAP